MSTRKVFHCIVDDTALITNISEIENWVSTGAITLFIPLYTLGRLHLLKKDASQIGTNARKAVKFLDRVTSGKDGEVLIQELEEQYTTWAEVETHYTDDAGSGGEEQPLQDDKTPVESSMTNGTSAKEDEGTGGALSQMLLSKLNFAKEPAVASPTSTPPTSPSSSGPQSSKTSPEVKSATMAQHDASPTPPALKPLINAVVWYTCEKKDISGAGALFLTNAADTANLVRSFGITPKNIHQLRSLINLEEQEVKNQDKYQQKHPTPPSTVVAEAEPEPQPLFRYEQESDDEEDEVLFIPRGRGSRTGNSVRGSPSTTMRRKNSLPGRSPIPIFATPASQNGRTPASQLERRIPIEEIDPDSFDRGSFGRGSVPLVNTSNHASSPFQGFPRGPRGNFAPGGPLSRGGFNIRGPATRGERGSIRGRRLFVP